MKSIQAKIFSGLIMVMATITIFFACKKISSDSGSTTPPVVSSSVAGQITDLNNVPISNATVTAGTLTTSTDINGHFTIENAQLNKDAGFVQISKTGYFNGSRTFVVSAGTVNNVKIQIIPKVVSGNFATASGDTVNVSGGGSVSFVANSMTNAATGAAYNGNVYVSTFYLNPADTNFNQYMPGDLRGISTSNQQNIIRVFGMASIEMDDANGEKLQLATGKTATITLPIPSSMQVNAPATIALWYFDETKGLWKQEGSATKQGVNYVGSVAHFTFWAAGELGQSVNLTATFKDSANNVFANKLVTITSVNYGTKNSYTDSAGSINGLVPANEALVMKVLDGCGDIMYTNNIGPYNADTSLGKIVISSWYNSNPLTVILTGNVVNCNNAAVTNGFAQLNVNGTIYNSVITNGNFSITFTQCYPSYSFIQGILIAYDVTDSTHSSAQIINFNGAAQNTGQIIACISSNPPIQFINLTLNGVNYSWASGTDSIGFTQIDSPGHYITVLTGGVNNSTKNISLEIDHSDDSSGSYTFYHLSINVNGSSYNSNFGVNTLVTTDITQYGGSPVEYIIGTTAGQFSDIGISPNMPFSISYQVVL
ncbi:MAG TPA: carboxypeptidase-like regulatory domain-containing protein [Puia sp.]|nr:carboxypeptidase-like regulatory domain-containing protein [Puia sp.]